MKRLNIPLQHWIDIIIACIVLHYMCTIGNEKFDIKLIKEAKRKLNRQIRNKLSKE